MLNNSPAIVSQPDTVPNSYLTRIMEVMLEHGKDITPYLQAANIPLPQLSNLEANLSSEQYYLFIENLLNEMTIEGIGFKVGNKFSISDYGILGYAFLSSPTLLDAFETFFRYQAIVGNDSMFQETMSIDGDDVILSFTGRLPSKELYTYEVDLFLGQWANTLHSISTSGLNLRATRVNISHAKPSYAKLYDNAFNCPIYYEQAENQIFVPREMLNQKSDMLSNSAAQACEQQCKDALKNLQQQYGLAEKVRRLIIENTAMNQGGEEMASQLNMSYRTLRRRLSEEGTSFKEINEKVRMSMASEYLLKTEFSTQEIAFLLGFSEVANFHRSFKKWSKLTPGEFRTQGK